MREYFFVLILLLLLLINLYVVIKLSHHIPILKKNRILKWGLLFYGFSYLLGVYFVEHFNKNFVGDFLTFSGGIYLAFLNYMFLTFILIDIFYIDGEKRNDTGQNLKGGQGIAYTKICTLR